MASEILSLLEERLAGGLRFYEFRAGALQGTAARASVQGGRLANHGAYLLARAPKVAELWSALRTTRAVNVPLVLLPPVSAEEEARLLRQLPEQPPVGGALVLFNLGDPARPRAVFHSEASLLASARQLAQAFPGEAPLACLLPAWGMSGVIFQVLLPALRGGTPLFSEVPFADWAAHAGPMFTELGVDLLVLTPSLLEVAHRAGLNQHWRGSVISLAAPLRRAALATYALKAGRRPFEIYGMMETAGPVLLNGRSLGAETRISPRYELEIRGPQLFLGYGVDGEFRPSEEWFRTGDIFTDEDGIFLHQARESAPVLQT